MHHNSNQAFFTSKIGSFWNGELIVNKFFHLVIDDNFSLETLADWAVECVLNSHPLDISFDMVTIHQFFAKLWKNFYRSCSLFLIDVECVDFYFPR